MNIHSYPKVYNLGHPALADLLTGEVVCQEKYDGSQFSWCWDSDGRLHARSKGGAQFGGPDNRTVPDAIFGAAVEHLLAVDPVPGPVFRGEAFSKPKHNTVAYGRMPRGGVVLFDVETDPNVFLPFDLHVYADRLGVEPAVELWRGDGAELNMGWLNETLGRESSLGSALVEGVVIKNYGRFGPDGKILAGKHVSEAFKERHKREWRAGNPGAGNIVARLVESLNTEARWRKAIAHLRDEGLLEGSPRDIGPLMAELKRDTVEEEREWVAERLLEWALPKVARGVGRGFPDWYKRLLAEQQFE